MKRLAILVAATAAVIALLVTIRALHGPEHNDRPAAISPGPTPRTAGSRAASTSTSPPPHYRSGTVTRGDHTDFGDVRLRVTTRSGRIVHIDVLEIPHANEVDRQLSQPAVHMLTDEVLRVQTAAVDIVSGATYTSEGYLASLQAALDQLS
jgi:uncharacterized protein with FMN-binding domain